MANLNAILWREEARRDRWSKGVLQPILSAMHTAYSLSAMQSDPHVADIQPLLANIISKLEKVQREREEWEAECNRRDGRNGADYA